MKSNFFDRLHRSIGNRLGWSSALILSAGMTCLAASPSFAADRLVFRFGPLGRSIPVEDLRTLADTGQVTPQLRWYVNIANVEPTDFQQALTQEVNVNQQLIDRATYSLPGEFALSQIGNTIHTRSRQANIQALRAALLLSTREDDRLSLIEFLEEYPTPEVHVDGRSLLTFVQDVNRVRGQVQPVVTAIETFLETFVCNCQPPNP